MVHFVQAYIPGDKTFLLIQHGVSWKRAQQLVDNVIRVESVKHFYAVDKCEYYTPEYGGWYLPCEAVITDEFRIQACLARKRELYR